MKKNKILFTVNLHCFCIFVFIFSFVTVSYAQNKRAVIDEQKSFYGVIDYFLKSIKEKNQKIFFSFFNDDIPFKAQIPTYLSQEDIADNLDALHKTQKDWFEDKATTFYYDIKDIKVKDDLGLAQVSIKIYKPPQKLSAGVYVNYDSLFLFKKVKEKWFFTFNDNVKI